jgi:hypothetical protein
MSDDKKKFVVPEGHRPPITRRDFLSHGLIPLAGYVMMPNILTQILKMSVARAAGVQADPCLATGGSGYMPFLVFDLAGGAGLPGHFLVGKKGPEDMIASYDTLGWNPRASGAIDKSFGIPMAANNVSQILTGIKQTASQEAQKFLRMGSFCHFSQDDTQTNRTSALSLISKAGLKGQFLQNGVGTVNSLSGGNSDVALKDLTLKPTFVAGAQDIQNSVSHGPAFDNFSDDELKSMSRAVMNFSAAQMQEFQGLSESEQFALLSECGYKKNLAYGKVVQGLDASQDQNARQIYQNANVTDASGNRVDNAALVSVAYNVIKGNTGPGAITIGGFDYHGKDPQFTQAKDLEAGRQIGAAVELAYRNKTPFFFQIVTDGGLASSPGTRQWASDSNVRSLTVIGYFNPNKAPTQRRLQVGEYTDGGTVNQQTLIGDEPSKVANAVLANYLSACGKIGEFEKTTQVAFRNADLDSILIFG